MNARFQPDTVSLDKLEIGTKARVLSIDWASRDEAEACRLRHFGFDEGVTVQPLHLGPFGRDPIAIRVGRMTVALRRRPNPVPRRPPARRDPPPARRRGSRPADPVNPLPLVAVAGSPNAGKS